MKTSDFYYHLPQELIAQSPLEPRDSCRLMVVDRRSGKIEHTIFKNLPRYLGQGDCLVINDTRVFPARLRGYKAETKGKPLNESIRGKVEVLLLSQVGHDEWQALVKPGRRLPAGAKMVFGNGLLRGYIKERLPGGERIVSFQSEEDFQKILHKIGEIPLPPYIHKPLAEPERYQTIFARKEGSVAAPTAGLHFTEELLKELKEKGVNFAFITLKIGLDTFRPIQTENIEEHKIHQEYYQVSEETAQIVNRAIEEGQRIIAVGTTSVRVLETVSEKKEERKPLKPGSGWTDLFIYPGHQFKMVDGLVTNFHLPKSSLLVLVSAFAGRDLVMRAYQEAIKEKYRFFSFGDCMLIL